MKSTLTKKLLFLWGFLGSLMLDATCGDLVSAQEYKIIVNAANPLSTISKDQVSKLFLKKVTRWQDGKTVLPVDLGETSPVRAKFSNEIHGKPVSAIRAFWQNRIFSGRGVPPPEKSSESEVVAYVLENPDAIGYVSTSAIVDKVKVLKIADQGTTLDAGK